MRRWRARRLMVAACEPVTVFGRRWVVLAQQPRDEAFGPVRVMGLQMGGGLAALALVGGEEVAPSMAIAVGLALRKVGDKE